MLRTFFTAIALALLAVFITSCGTDHAEVRTIHGSPDAPAVDVVIDGQTVATNVAYEGLAPASGYLTVTAGNRKFEVRATGTTTDLINSAVDFGAQKEYTVVVSGCVAPQDCNQPPGNSTVAAVLKTDDNSAPGGGSVKLRVVYVSPSGPLHVDIYVVAPGTDITNMSPTVSALAYQQASGYESVSPSLNEVILTDTSDNSKTRLIDQTYTLTGGQIRTLVILDVPGGGAISPTPLVVADLN